MSKSLAENHLKWYGAKVRELLSKEEIDELLERNNFKAAIEIMHTWFWITASFLLVAIYPNVITVIVALFIIGGKQLACAIIMHDASHYALFKTKKANIFWGNWLGAYPIFHDVMRYRPYHIEHHVSTGTDRDPDLSLTRGYPTSVASFIRKMLRDLSGATGIKGYAGVFAMHFGVLKYNLGGTVERIRYEHRTVLELLQTVVRNLAGPFVFNVLLFSIFFALGKPLLYLLWIGAMLTTMNFSLRIRSIAEHSVVPDRNNPQKNTRTTYANWLERMLFAPHYVNYHAEHHLLMPAPPYNLPRMHLLLKQRGYFKEGILENNYWSIIKLATGKKAVVSV